MFDCSNEIKWLLSDIQYHDILSLNTFQKGTMLPMEEYNSVFKEAKILELGNYGLDPFKDVYNQSIWCWVKSRHWQ